MSRRRLLSGLAHAGFAVGAGGCFERPPQPPAGGEGGAVASDDGAQRYADLEGLCAGVPAIAAAEYVARQRQAQAFARDAGIDALLVEAGASLTYFTGVRWGRSERPLVLLVPCEGEPRIFGPAFEAGTLRERVGDGLAIELWDEHEGPYGRLAGALSGLRRVAVEPSTRLFIVDYLRRAAPTIDLVADPGIVRSARIIKSPAELALLRRANVATKAAVARVAPGIRPGMRESEIAAEIEAALRAAGLRDIWVLALVGANAAFPHGTDNERVLEEGDGVLIDTGGSLHGYRSDISRTWFLGDPPPAVCDAWAVVLEAQAKALAAMRPGATCGSIDAVARATIDATGHGPGYRRFTHRLGHGIGLEVHEEPYLVGGAPTLLAPGMVMSNEPGIYVPNEWGIRIEDIVVITEGGAEVFGPRPRSITDPFGEAPARS